MDYIELTFKFEPLLPTREILIAELGELGFESFLEEEDGLKAYVQANDFNEVELAKLSENNWYKNINYEKKTIEDQNWNAVWESNFEQVIVDDKCLIRANFHPKNGGFLYEIEISPQMSFGTGHHGTTRLMIENILNLPVEGEKVLDMGCGTGVLAILCSMMGAVDITAVDTDDWAISNTNENIAANNVKDKIKVIKGSVENVGEEGFGLILANINKNVLLNHLKEYFHKLRKNGNLILSGFYKVDEDQLMSEALSLGFEKVGICHDEEWSSIHLKKIK